MKEQRLHVQATNLLDSSSCCDCISSQSTSPSLVPEDLALSTRSNHKLASETNRITRDVVRASLPTTNSGSHRFITKQSVTISPTQYQFSINEIQGVKVSIRRQVRKETARTIVGFCEECFHMSCRVSC